MGGVGDERGRRGGGGVGRRGGGDGSGSASGVRVGSWRGVIPARDITHAAAQVNSAVHAVKLAVMGVTRKLMDDDDRLPLENRTMAVLVDGSRMSLLALELAGAVWKFGRCGRGWGGVARG